MNTAKTDKNYLRYLRVDWSKLRDEKTNLTHPNRTFCYTRVRPIKTEKDVPRQI